MAAGAVLFGAVACNKSSTAPIVACTQVAVPSLSITVVDSASGQPMLFTGLWARAKEGAYVDSVAVNLGDKLKGAVVIPLAYEHEGTLAVAVHADGYLLWTISGIGVMKDACHVKTVSLTARLAH